MEQSNEIKNAIELLTANGYEVFHAPFVSISGYIKNMEHDLAIYRRRDKMEREEEKRKEEARKKRQANKEMREEAKRRALEHKAQVEARANALCECEECQKCPSHINPREWYEATHP